LEIPKGWCVMVKSLGLWVVGIVCVVGGVAGVLSAQTARSAQPSASSSNDELLAEVRALRAELNLAAGASIRAQVLVARLQSQEQRINVASGQLLEVRRLLTVEETTQLGQATELKRLQDVSGGSATPDEKKNAEGLAAQLEPQLAQSQKEAQRLRQQEAEISSQLAADQGRWIDFNSRLDELERQLPRR
jgi:valyl-tRNA synthetase